MLGRADLMRFLRDECEQRSVTIVYATHIFDGRALPSFRFSSTSSRLSPFVSRFVAGCPRTH